MTVLSLSVGLDVSGKRFRYFLCHYHPQHLQVLSGSTPTVTGEGVNRMGAQKVAQKLQDWVVARKRHHLSHAHVQMARELGFNPKKLRGKDNHRQEPWKLPLPEFIADLYRKRFGRAEPENVLSIEEHSRLQRQRKAVRKATKLERLAG